MTLGFLCRESAEDRVGMESCKVLRNSESAPYSKNICKVSGHAYG